MGEFGGLASRVADLDGGVVDVAVLDPSIGGMSARALAKLNVKIEYGEIERQDHFPAPNVGRSDDMVKFPFQATRTPVEEHFFIHMKQSIPTVLQANGITSAQAKFHIRTSLSLVAKPVAQNAINIQS